MNIFYFIMDEGGPEMSPLWDMTTMGGGRRLVMMCVMQLVVRGWVAGLVTICVVCDRA